jgi:hypothetical protein
MRLTVEGERVMATVGAAKSENRRDSPPARPWDGAAAVLKCSMGPEVRYGP